MIIASFVTKNEEARWFESVLAHTSNFVDEIFVYDDRSTDGTVELALGYTSNVVIRDEQDPTFTDHESKFRLNAKHAMIEKCNPTENDYILALDADEFFVGRGISDERQTIDNMVAFCNKGHNSMNIMISEIWDVSGAFLLSRVDGFWAKNSAPRFYRYQEDPVFLNKQMGCGSVPTYALKGMQKNVSISSILHFGYANPQDRLRKYDFYKSRAHGHNPSHIESIIGRPELREYHGRVPKFWYGRG